MKREDSMRDELHLGKVFGIKIVIDLSWMLIFLAYIFIALISS